MHCRSPAGRMQQHPVGVTRLAAATGIPKTTVHRLLQQLAQEDVVASEYGTVHLECSCIATPFALPSGEPGILAFGLPMSKDLERL
jgi:hypothetical protein